MKDTNNSETATATMDEIDFDGVYLEGDDSDDGLDDVVDAITSPEEEDSKTAIDQPAEVEASDEDDDEDAEDPVEDDEPQAETDAEEISLFEELNQRLGYEVEGEFEGVDGLVDYAKQVGGKMAEAQLEAFFSQHPDVKEYMDYRQNGGDPRAFFEVQHPQVSYGEIDAVPEDDVSLQSNLVREALSLTGMDDEDIATTIEEYRASGLLQKQAERNLKVLQRYEAEQKERLIEENQRAAQIRAEETEKFWNDTRDLIHNTPTFDGIPLAEKEKAEFFDFISKPVGNEAVSERDKIVQGLDLQQRLMIDALLFHTKKKGRSLGDILERKAASRSARDLKERLLKKKTSVKGDTPERDMGSSLENIDFGAF